MSYDGSVCFLVVYHYESNAILALSIADLKDKTIFDAYKIAFDTLALKGFKPKLIIMNNQATKTPACQAAQPQSECGQTHHPDLQGCIHCRPRNYQFGVPPSIMEPPHATGGELL
jgi:hypothetical protein